MALSVQFWHASERLKTRPHRHNAARRPQVLHEVAQRHGNGLERRRDGPLSEKRLPGEAVWATARRGILEELDGVVSSATAIRFPSSDVRTRIVESTSKSYPGVPSRYFISEVDAIVDGLPREPQFETHEGPASDACVHVWAWRDA